MINRLHAIVYRPERGWGFVLVQFVRICCSQSIDNPLTCLRQLILHTKQDGTEALTTRMGAAP